MPRLQRRSGRRTSCSIPPEVRYPQGPAPAGDGSHRNHGGCSSAGRAPGCGPGRRGFESRHSPQGLGVSAFTESVPPLLIQLLLPRVDPAWPAGYLSSAALVDQFVSGHLVRVSPHPNPQGMDRSDGCRLAITTPCDHGVDPSNRPTVCGDGHLSAGNDFSNGNGRIFLEVVDIDGTVASDHAHDVRLARRRILIATRQHLVEMPIHLDQLPRTRRQNQAHPRGSRPRVPHPATPACHR